MNIYRYKTIVSNGLMLDCDLGDLGKQGWDCIGIIPLYRRIPGALGSEKGITQDQGNGYVYLFKQKIEPHSFEGRLPLLSRGPCVICGLDLVQPIHIGVKRA